MKTYLYIILTVCLFGINLNAQTKAKTISKKTTEINHTVKDNYMDFKMPVEEAGVYSVFILSPSGEIMTWPLKDKEYSKGQSVELTVNTKYWRSGSYRIQVLNEEDGRTVETYTLSVGLTARKKSRI